MARSQYSDMALAVDSLGAITAYPEVRIHVYTRGSTTNYAGIFTAATGSNPLANPFVTANAKIEFWAEAGAYDIRIEDTVAPARFAPRTVAWDATPAVVGGFPTNFLARDGGMLISMLGAEVLRQLIPLGQIIDWWRPSSSVPLPDGFVPADGRTLVDADHDFPVSGSITLPDMRNRMALGADSTKADGTAAGTGDAASAAPGIGAVGGSNTKDLSHAHTMAHTHNIAHEHVINSPISIVAGVLAVLDPRGNTHQSGEVATGITTTSHAYVNGASFASAAGERYRFDTTSGPTNSGGSSAANTGNGLTAAIDMRSRYVGLLKLMKVRRV